MDIRTMVRRGVDRLEPIWPLAGGAIALLTRLVIGMAFYSSGKGKWANFDRTVSFFTDIGIPMPQANAAFVASLELVGGIALILGLCTRLFATGLASTMIVALMTADKENFLNSWKPVSEVSPTDVAAFVFLLFLGWLIAFGPGPVSIDHFFRKWIRSESRSR